MWVRVQHLKGEKLFDYFIENNYSTESIRGFVEYSKTEEYINYMAELILLIKEQNKPMES